MRRHRRRDEKFEAVFAELAVLREAVTQLRRDVTYRRQVPEPAPALLLHALAAPSRDGDLLPLTASGREFLVVTGPGAESPDVVWEAAASLALAAGPAPLPACGQRKIGQVFHRDFPGGLQAVAVADAGGDLLVWLNVLLPVAERRSALQKIKRPRPGYRRAAPLAAPVPFALLLRHPVRAAAGTVLAVAGTAFTVATLHTASPGDRQHPRLAVPAAVVSASPAASSPRHRHHRRHARGAAVLQHKHAVPAATPVSSPLLPVPSLSPGGLLPSPARTAAPARTSRACVEILGIRVCVPPLP